MHILRILTALILTAYIWIPFSFASTSESYELVLGDFNYGCGARRSENYAFQYDKIGASFTNVAAISSGYMLQADLVEAAFSISFQSGGNGTLTGTTSQSISYGGTATTLTAIPNTGYHFVT